MRSLPTTSFDSPYIATLIRGGGNLEMYSTEAKHTRKVMTMALLKVLGHEIAKTDWPTNSKQVVWCACTTAFFGSFRLGEILPASEHNAHPSDTLLWKDINVISNEHVLVHVKVTKSTPHTGGLCRYI